MHLQTHRHGDEKYSHENTRTEFFSAFCREEELGEHSRNFPQRRKGSSGSSGQDKNVAKRKRVSSYTNAGGVTVELKSKE